MDTYLLRATLDNETNEITFEARDSFEATMDAIHMVMDRAMTSPLWAKGAIALIHNGKVIHAMEAKP